MNWNDAMELKHFDKNDWMGYAGAEPGPNGEEPMICHHELADVLADAQGVGVEMWVMRGGDQIGVRSYGTTNENYRFNVTMARGLTEEQLNEEALLAMGFELLNEFIWGEADPIDLD